VIPLIVIPTLLFSLVESLFILPAHLSHFRREKEERAQRGLFRLWHRFDKGVSDALEVFIDRVYRPSVEFALRWRYLTIAWAVATLIVTVGLVGGGHVRWIFFPEAEADNIVAYVTMPPGTPVEVTSEAVRRLEASAEKVREEIEGGGEGKAFRHVLASVGVQPYRLMQHRGPASDAPIYIGSNLGEVNVELVPSEERTASSEDLGRRWRDLTGAIPDAVELSFSTSIFSAGEPINIQLTSSSIDDLRKAADRLKEKLATKQGVFEITDSFREGKQEVKLRILPEAEALGLSLSDLARQVRQGFYGEEAQRVQRGRDDVKVMIRYPEEDRQSLGDLENMRIRTPEGGEVPFSSVAVAEIGQGYAAIRRADRRRAINVTADVDEKQQTAGEILAELQRDFLPTLVGSYPGMAYTLEGAEREQRETMQGIFRSYILLVLPLIYVLMAIPFRSYLQPIIVMSAIPFGLVGAVWGHVIMGLDLSVISMFGLVALTGVVVNDSLVLVDYINRRRGAGDSPEVAARKAGMVRFRPILLTSLTTFAGVAPLLIERSVQAAILIPMAVSLGFGVVFSTFITLVLVPSSYLILEDFRRGWGWVVALYTGPTEEESTGSDPVPDGS
jgi:multidrug efflux pump subunit AcrB